MKNWMLAISLIILGGSISACADGTSWKEEVLQHDGKKLVVGRSQSYGGRHEIGQSPPIKEQELTFTLPNSKHPITWKSGYSEDVGRANLNLLALHVLNGTPYIVAEPNLCLAYNKWGRPNPPYVLFKYDGKDWQRISMSEFPAQFKDVNVVVNSLGAASEGTIVETGLITAEKIREFNSRLWRYPNEQLQYKTILREPMKTGRCPQYSRGPKAPMPIPPKPGSENK